MVRGLKSEIRDSAYMGWWIQQRRKGRAHLIRIPGVLWWFSDAHLMKLGIRWAATPWGQNQCLPYPCVLITQQNGWLIVGSQRLFVEVKETSMRRFWLFHCIVLGAGHCIVRKTSSPNQLLPLGLSYCSENAPGNRNLNLSHFSSLPPFPHQENLGNHLCLS